MRILGLAIGLAALALGPGLRAQASAAAEWKSIERFSGMLPKLQQKADEGAAGANQAVTNHLALLQSHLDWFIRQYPEDRHIIVARAWYVVVAPQVAEGLKSTLDQSRWEGEIARLEAATNLLPAEQVDVDYALIDAGVQKAKILGITRPGYQQLLERLERFATSYPKDSRTGRLAFTWGELVQTVDEEKARKAFTLARAHYDEDYSDKAARALAVLPYRTRPLDLTFPANGGGTVDFKVLRGRVVVVDFWASWCPPCVREAPEMVGIYQRYQGKGVAFVGICLDNNPSEMAKFIKKVGMTWPQYFDAGGWETKWSRKFNVSSIPTVWIVGKDGRVVSIDARGSVEKLIKQELAR